jgi:hypothetical protein
MAENTLKDIQMYLGADGAEFRNFWTGLTDEEKAEFKAAELPKS